MDDDVILIVLAAAGAVLAGIAWLVVLSRRHRQRVEQTWRDFAGRHGLAHAFDRGGLEAVERQGRRGDRLLLRGALRGRAFTVKEVSVNDGDSDSSSPSVRTRFSLAVAGMPAGLLVHPRPPGRLARGLINGALSLATRLGADLPPEAQSGDPAFDDTHMIRAHDPPAARAWLTDPARRATMTALAAEEDLHILDRDLCWQGDRPKTVEAMEEVVARLEVWAGRLERK
ncbi:MAG: hypothetical protein H6907_07595 [Hyphomicrobiales bacterium]|nr:hypothetical protein [Hyphomicrobiales bacterium]